MFSNSVYGQNVISGNIKDINNNPIAFANIIVSENNKLAIVAFCSSDYEGNYKLEFSKAGTYDVSFLALSYKKEVETITISETSTKIIKNIILKNELNILKEVIVTKKDIEIKNDTIIFQASRFLTGNESTIEDLLKKIPGVTVSENGTIKVNNQQIEKILIDDDDLFDKGYKLLSKNLNAAVVEKIAIYQNYSSNKLLKNIEDSKKVALNLTLKNKNSKWSGNANLASGINDKFDSKINAIKFFNVDKYFLIGSANNIGKEITGDIDEIIDANHDGESGYIGENQNSYSIINLKLDKPTEINTERSNINNDKLISLSSISKITKKIKLKSFSFISSNNDISNRSVFQKIISNNENIINNESSFLNKNETTFFSNGKLIYDISKDKTFENNFEIDSKNCRDFNDFNYNTTIGNEQLQTIQNKINNTFKFTNRFKKDQVYLISGKISYEKQPQIYTLNNIIIGTQNFENTLLYKGVQIDYLKNKNKKLLFANTLGIENRNDLLNSNLMLNQNLLPPKLANKIVQNRIDIFIISKLKLKLSDDFSIKPIIELHNFRNSLSINDVTDITNLNYANFSLESKYKLSNKNRLSLFFSINNENSTIIDQYDGSILTDFNSFNIGTGKFSQFKNQSINFRHSIGDFGSKFFSNTSITFKKNEDYFSTNTLFSKNYFSTSKIIQKNQYITTIYSNTSYYLKWISSNLKFDFSYYRSNYDNYFNTELNNVKVNNLMYGLELRSAFNYFFNYHIGTKFKNNNINFNLIENQIKSNNTFINISLEIAKNINLDFNNDYYLIKNNLFDKNTAYFSDIQLNFKLIESKTNFKIIYQNIFNTDFFIESANTETSFLYKKHQLLPKYLILNIDFKF